MASYTAAVINKVFGAVNGALGGVLPMLETPSGGMANAQAGASGGALTHATGARHAAGVNGALTPAALGATAQYDPPLRQIWCSADATVVVQLAGDTGTATTVALPLKADTPWEGDEIASVVSKTAGTVYGCY